MPNIPILLFSKGEVTPLIDARNDTEAYQASCRHLENFIARVYGAAERRPGTYYICGMRDSDDTTPVTGVTKALLMPFIYSEEISYLLEFTEYYIRIFYEDDIVDEIASPYLEEDLLDLQFKQLGDVIWITHSSYAPRKLSRISATDFTLLEIPFENGPFLVRNDLSVGNGTTMEPSGTSELDIGDDITNDSGCVYAASTEYGSFGIADYAFNDKLIPPYNFWRASTQTNAWVSCQWTSGKTIKQVRIQPCGSINNSNFNPKHIKIEASNNGTDWTKVSISAYYGRCSSYNTDEAELEKINNYTDWCQLTLNNTTSYTYYRVFCYDLWDGDGGGGRETRKVPYITINEIEMMEDADASYQEHTLTCSDEYFSEDHVGALFALTQPRTTTEVTLIKTATDTGYSSSLLVEGTFSFNTHGTWEGTVKLERTVDNQYWDTYRTWTAKSDRNIQLSGVEEEDNVYYRINVTTLTTGTISCDLSVMDSTQTGICKVTTYISASVVGISILKEFASTDPTARWAEGCWSDFKGYPSSVTFLEGRCIYAGMKILATEVKLATVWFSEVDNYEDFKEGVNAADAFSVTIPTTETLTWVEAMDNLIVGTNADTWFIRSSKIDTPLMPDPPPIVRQQSGYGCDPIRPVDGGKTLLYVSGRQLRELAYDRESSKYDSDMTVLAEHFTASPIVNIAMQYNPEMVLWCVHEDGDLSVFVYEREHNVTAWSKIPLAGDVQSVCVLPDRGSGDDVYISINRTITGKTVVDGDDTVYDGDEVVTDKLYPIYIEKFAKRFE